MRTLRLFAGELLLLIAAFFEWAAIEVGGEILAPRYIEDIKRRAEMLG